jgi:hypothetical protein
MGVKEILKEQLVITDKRAEFLEELILEELADQCPNWEDCCEICREGGY